jgi:hypothetical protein
MAWILAIPAFSTPGFALGSVLPDFLPADTKLVIGIQLRHIIDSPLGKELAAHVVTMPQSQVPALQVGGIDFMRDVDDVLVAANGAQKATGLLVLKGRFSGPPTFEDPQHPGMLLAILDPNTAIAGETGVVRAAIAQRGHGAPLPALEARAEALAAQYDIWGAGDQIDSIDGFSFGAALRQGLDLTAEVVLHSAADVAKINEFVKPLEAMLHSQSSATKFHLGIEGRTLRLALNVPEEELKKAIDSQKQLLTSAFLQQMQQMQPKPKPKAQLKILNDPAGNTVNVRLGGGK